MMVGRLGDSCSEVLRMFESERRVDVPTETNC